MGDPENNPLTVRMRSGFRGAHVTLSCMKPLLLMIIGLALVLSACGSSGEAQVEQMTETLVRTASSTQGQAELAEVGVEVSGPLSCQTTPEGSDISVACTGTALDGRPVTVAGTATSMPGGQSVEGTFVGTAGATQVFSLDCLGC
jgi:hypothetical protein